MNKLSLFLLLTGAVWANAEPAVEGHLYPGAWMACDLIPSICELSPATPGLATWMLTISTDAAADIAWFQVAITYNLPDGTPGMKTFVFLRDDQPYGRAPNGSPIYYSAYTVPLGKVKSPNVTVTLLKSSGFSKTFPAN